MRLLIFTQKIDINDDVLGFFHNWVKELAKHCDRVIVVCLEKGTYDLPENVLVFSLGKERLKALLNGYIVKLLYCLWFFKYSWKFRNEYNAVFIHMNPEYVLLGGVLWRLWNKKIGLWYAHGHVNFYLKIAEKLTNIIFTSTTSGCRIQSEKIKVVGQGIDVLKFKPTVREKNEIFKIITVGRISPSKDYETLIKAIDILVKEGFKIHVDIIGGVGLAEQQEYLENIKKLVMEKNLNGVINFLGPIPNKDVVAYLQQSDLFVNMGHTGSLDKAVPEAMACGLVILTCNEALEEVLGDYQKILMYPKKDFIELANKIKWVMAMSTDEKEQLRKDLREIVIKNHSVADLIKKILSYYSL